MVGESKDNFLTRIFMKKLLMEYIRELEDDPAWQGRVMAGDDPHDPNYYTVRFYLGRKQDGR